MTEITFQPVRKLSVSWTAYSDNPKLVRPLRKVNCVWITAWTAVLLPGRALPVPHRYPEWVQVGAGLLAPRDPGDVLGCTGPLAVGSPQPHRGHGDTWGQLPCRTGDFTFCVASLLTNRAARSSHAKVL